jgi:hypothetical protein
MSVRRAPQVIRKLSSCRNCESHDQGRGSGIVCRYGVVPAKPKGLFSVAALFCKKGRRSEVENVIRGSRLATVAPATNRTGRAES